MKRIGFSVGDTIKLYWLYKAQHGSVYPAQLYTDYTQQFPGRKIQYDQVARLAKKMEADGLLTVSLDKNKKMYTTTPQGLEVYQRYKDLYYERLSEIQKVLKRIHYHVTKSGQPPGLPEKPLPQEFRAYFAKLVSVKDVVRYMIFSLAQTRTEFYIAEVNDQLASLFGWSPSNTYLYEIAREMEAEGTLIGRWKEPDKRTIRIVKATEDGMVFSKQITNSLNENVSEVLHHIDFLLEFIRT